MNINTACQFWPKLYLLLGIFVLLGALNLDAQKIGVNEQGDSIVVYNDGSWRYFNAEIDSELLVNKTVINKPVATSVDIKPATPAKPIKNDPLSGSSKKKKSKKSKAKKSKDKKARNNPYEKSEAKSKKKKKGKSKSKSKKSSKAKKKGKSKKSKKKKPNKKGKPAKVKKEKVPTIKYTDLQEERFRMEAIRDAERAGQNTQLKLIAYQELTYDRVLLEDDLKLAYTSPNTTDEQIVNIEKKIQSQREVEDEAGRIYLKAKEESDLRNKIIDVPHSKRLKMLEKWNASTAVINPKNEAGEIAPVEITKTNSTVVNDSKQSLKAQKELRTLANIIANPPERTCPDRDVRYNEFTGKKMVTLNKEFFFSKTPDHMRALLKDRQYLSCNASLSNTGGITFLELEIVIASTSANKAYGIIEKGSKLSIKMIDGYTVSLTAAKSAPGEVNNLDKTITYRPRYFLEKTFIKSFEKSEIDQARMVWMTGYEDYEIYDVEFLKHQIRCLKGK